MNFKWRIKLFPWLEHSTHCLLYRHVIFTNHPALGVSAIRLLEQVWKGVQGRMCMSLGTKSAIFQDGGRVFGNISKWHLSFFVLLTWSTNVWNLNSLARNRKNGLGGREALLGGREGQCILLSSIFHTLRGSNLIKFYNHKGEVPNYQNPEFCLPRLATSTL